MVWGLVGDNCKNESAEKCDAEAGGQHDVARRKGGFEFGFGFVGHGFGFGLEYFVNFNTAVFIGLHIPMASQFKALVVFTNHNLVHLSAAFAVNLLPRRTSSPEQTSPVTGSCVFTNSKIS